MTIFNVIRCISRGCVGCSKFFSFLLMYVSDFPMILGSLDTLYAVCIEIHSDEIVILTDSFCTANPYVLKFQPRKTVQDFAKSWTALVEVDENRYELSLKLKIS